MIWNAYILFQVFFTFLSVGYTEEMTEKETEYRVATTIHKIRQSPSINGSLRGIIYAGDVFEVGSVVGYKDCEAGWAEVSGGYVCLISTKKVEDKPKSLPSNLSVLPPSPDQEEETIIVATEVDPAYMPTLHGKRDAEHKGRLWKSIESYEKGDSARWKLSLDRDYLFIAAHETKKGWVLERPNGSIAPISDVYLYPSSRFAGRDTEKFPIQEGAALAFVMKKEGVPLYWEPSKSADTLLTLEYRRSIDVQKVSLDEAVVKDDQRGTEEKEKKETEAAEEWWEVPMGELVGYVPRSAIRLWKPLKKPKAIEDDEIWIDADIETQMLAVMRGEIMLYLTLMSSAKKGHETPLGRYRIYDKSTGWDLGSLDGADDAYYMERVPYVMHYYPRYAIHSAFWHDNFGEPASHGCLNLSVKDARVVFDLVSPELPDGWRYVKQTNEHVGTAVRVRNGSKEGKSKIIGP